MMVSGIYLAVSYNAQTTVLRDQSTEIATLQNEIEQKSMAVTEHSYELIRSSTGLNFNRIESDSAVATEFIRKCMTWKSWTEYMQNRDTLKHDYNLEEDSRFISVFMPNVPNNTDAEGNNYNRIDQFGLNMEFVSMNSWVVGIEGTTYAYMAEVTWRTSDNLGSTATSTDLFEYSVNADGELVNLNAWLLAT